MANFLDIAPKRKTPAARKVCVDKIGSRPRGNLCVPKIRPGEPERRQTYGDIAMSVKKIAQCAAFRLHSARRAEACQTYRDIPSKPVKATIVLFYWLTRAWREYLTPERKSELRERCPSRPPAGSSPSPTLSAEHAPTPAHPRTRATHAVDINSPR